MGVWIGLDNAYLEKWFNCDGTFNELRPHQENHLMNEEKNFDLILLDGSLILKFIIWHLSSELDTYNFKVA